MSISLETVEKHTNEPAVTCCRTEVGALISADHLENPSIFPDLEDSGLLKIDEGVLKIKNVLGAKLIKTIDALTPITPDYLDSIMGDAPGVEVEASRIAPLVPALPASAQAISPMTAAGAGVYSGVIRIHIGEGKDMDIEIPLGVSSGGSCAAHSDKRRRKQARQRGNKAPRRCSHCG